MASNEKRTLDLDTLDTNRLRKSMEQADLLDDGLKSQRLTLTRGSSSRM